MRGTTGAGDPSSGSMLGSGDARSDRPRTPSHPRSPTASATSTPPPRPSGNPSRPARKPPRVALAEPNHPFGDFGRAKVPEQPALVAFEHATVWTSGPRGKLEDATVLVEKGKIRAVGKDVEVPSGAQKIDARGMHLTPGLIDCHSHTGIDGGVNEGTQANTAEVRIGDCVDPDDINWYRQLAGGLTACNQLHGSANPIGGQNSVDDKGQLVPGDLGAQTTQALHNLKLCLEAAGAGIDNLVKVTIYVAGDLDLMPGFQAWQKFAGQPTNPPIVTVLKVLALGRPGLLVEIEATAVLPG